MTSIVSERDYVTATMNQGKEDDSFFYENEKKIKKQREKNIRLLRKQVMALAQEELANVQAKKSVMEETIGTTNDQLEYRNQKTKNVNLIAAEDVDSGEIKWQDYKDFFAYSYGTCGIAMFFVLCVMTSVA